MTRTQAQIKRLEAMKQFREKRLSQPAVKELTPDKPFLPPVDSRQGGFIGKRVLLKDAQGRYIEL